MSPLPVDGPRARARELVLAFGWHPSSYQILNPGFDLWFAAAGDAVVGHVDHGAVRVVAGEPICPLDRLIEVVREFEREAARIGRRVCYLAAEDRLAAALAGEPRYTRIVIGAHPILDPAQWPATLAAHASLRAQLNRARNKGVRVAEWIGGEAGADPGLRRCLARWLGARGLPPLHFMVETETLGQLADRRVFVARRDGVAAFLVASPIPLRHGWLVEQIVRDPAAPNGSAELVVASAVEALGRDGARRVALGVAPLSGRDVGSDAGPAVAAMLRWAKAHGQRFYNVAGLERFKAKFQPAVWEPVFAISAEPAFSIGTLWAVAAAYCGGSRWRPGFATASQFLKQKMLGSGRSGAG